MRKLALFAAVAASLVGAPALFAQAPQAQTPQAQATRDSSWHGRRGGRGGSAMLERGLLENITLTAAQKTQLEQVRKAERAKMKADSGTRRADFDAIRKARESGDTATAKRLMQEQRTKMEARLQEHAAAVRAILTPDQQKQLDSNLAELKTRAGKFAGRGGRQWHGQKSPVV